MKAFCPFTVTVPASTANLGPGFDSLGMAVNLFLRMHVEPADRIEIDVTGLGAAEIAAEGKRLLTHIFEEVSRLRNEPLPPFRMTVKNEIPLARGLGSSASAVVGALVAADHLLGHPWSRDELFQLGTAIEGHPDNVAASLYGGLVVCTRDGDRPVALKLDPPDLPLVAAIPHHALKTKEARAVLPDGYSREDAVLSSSRSNLLVAALATGRWDLLSVAMQDLFHQPYRAHLVPGLAEAVEHAAGHGAWGAALSGAGPTLIAFARDVEEIMAFFKHTFEKLGFSADVVELRACSEGAVVTETRGNA